jgi:hypothetical protein
MGARAMITEIPTAAEFTEQGVNHLHLAWEIGISLLGELSNALDQGDVDEETSKDYWRLSQPALGNAFALIQQAQEFLLKGRIAAVSPFLLLSREARDWPRRCDMQDSPFSAFRMSDAADLLRIHNTVAMARLPADFAKFYEEVRHQRNAIMHFGLKGRTIDVTNVLVAILQTHASLVEGRSWPLLRWDYLNSDRISTLYSSSDHAGDLLLTEFETLISALKPASARRYLGFDSRARRYICPVCMGRTEYIDHRPALAQLRPNTPNSDEVYCFVCECTTAVIRESCPVKACKSNVLSDVDGTCLVCW